MMLGTNLIANRLGTKRQRFSIPNLIVMVLLGAAFLAFGFFMYKSTTIDPGWTRQTGKIVDVERSATGSARNDSNTYYAIVEYKVNDQVLRAKSAVATSPRPSLGSDREIAYNPSNPTEAKVVEGTTTKAMFFIFMGIGLVFVLLGPFLYVRSAKRGATITSLQQSGQKITGVVSDIQATGSAGGASTYKIVVTATNLSGQAQAFTSDSITGMGGISLVNFAQQPIPIDVYIDPANPEHYYVDISDIPSLTPESINNLVSRAMGKSPATETTPEVSPEPPKSSLPPGGGL